MVVDCLLPMAKTRQKPDLLQGTLDLLILRTLQWGPQHGHGIGVALRASSDEVLNVDHGSLYPALHRLERQGWVDAEWKLSDNKQRAKYYRISRGRPPTAGARAHTLAPRVGRHCEGARTSLARQSARAVSQGEEESDDEVVAPTSNADPAGAVSSRSSESGDG